LTDIIDAMLALALLAAALSAPADLHAVGIVMSSRPQARTAVLTSEGRTRVVGLGETAFGGRVAGIEPDRVTLDFGGTPVVLRLTAAAAVASAPAPPIPPAEAPVMERKDVERRLGEESSRILAETTLVPAMDQGRIAGFAITRMPEGTLLSDAGLMPGDVLSEVNGVPIDSLATLISLWPRLQAESAIHALVMRGGQPVTLSVSLR
jgi:general secretion pathway protein C